MPDKTITIWTGEDRTIPCALRKEDGSPYTDAASAVAFMVDPKNVATIDGNQVTITDAVNGSVFAAGVFMPDFAATDTAALTAGERRQLVIKCTESGGDVKYFLIKGVTFLIRSAT